MNPLKGWKLHVAIALGTFGAGFLIFLLTFNLSFALLGEIAYLSYFRRAINIFGVKSK